MTKPTWHSRHPERSRRIPWNYIKAFATGFLDFARNDRNWIRYSCLVICFALTPLSVFAEPTPSAKDILDSVRMSARQPDAEADERPNEGNHSTTKWHDL